MANTQLLKLVSKVEFLSWNLYIYRYILLPKGEDLFEKFSGKFCVVFELVKNNGIGTKWMGTFCGLILMKEINVPSYDKTRSFESNFDKITDNWELRNKVEILRDPVTQCFVINKKVRTLQFDRFLSNRKIWYSKNVAPKHDTSQQAVCPSVSLNLRLRFIRSFKISFFYCQHLKSVKCFAGSLCKSNKAKWT